MIELCDIVLLNDLTFTLTFFNDKLSMVAKAP